VTQVTELSVKFTGVEEVAAALQPPRLYQLSVVILKLYQVSFLNAGSGWQESKKITCHESVVPVMTGGVLACGLHKLQFEIALPSNLPPTIKCLTNHSAAKVTCGV
jgi:hypothetical protein